MTRRKMLVQFYELFLLLHWNVKSALPLLRSSPRSLLYERARRRIAVPLRSSIVRWLVLGGQPALCANGDAGF